MAGDLPSPATWPILLAPVPVGRSQPVAVAPVTLHLPGGDAIVPAVALPPGDPEATGVLQPGRGIDLYGIFVPPGTSSLRIDLTWMAPPPGASGSLLVFDGVGNLLIDQALDAASPSATVLLNGPFSTTGGMLYLGVQTGPPAGANSPGGASTYDLRATLNRVQVSSGTNTGGFGSSLSGSATAPAPPVPGVASGTVPIVPVYGVLGNLMANSAYPPSSVQQVGPAQGPWLSPVQGSGPVATPPTAGGGRDAQGSPSPSTPIDAHPLPGSPHEPAGGLLTDAAPAERVDPTEATRVEMSLVRRFATPREGARGDDPSSGPSSAASSALGIETGTTARGDNEIPVPPMVSDAPGSFRPERRPFPQPSRLPSALLPALAADGLLGGVRFASSAILPSIDGWDRPDRAAPLRRRDRDKATGDEGPPESGNDRSGAILLGLSGSAALGVGLYAPDLAAVARRVAPRRVPNPRSRSASRREPRASSE